MFLFAVDVELFYSQAVGRFLGQRRTFSKGSSSLVVPDGPWWPLLVQCTPKKIKWSSLSSSAAEQQEEAQLASLEPKKLVHCELMAAPHWSVGFVVGQKRRTFLARLRPYFCIRRACPATSNPLTGTMMSICLMRASPGRLSWPSARPLGRLSSLVVARRATSNVVIVSRCSSSISLARNRRTAN